MNTSPVPPPASTRRLAARRVVGVIGLVLAATALSGCWLFAANERINGHAVAAQYNGLANQTTAIVIYADQAQTDEFPNSRLEISSFLATQLRQDIPTIRLVDSRDVIDWQDDTLNWANLSMHDIARHFSVNRVIYIELLNYSAHAEGTFGDLQGHIRAACKVYDATNPGISPVWSDTLDILWPPRRPLDPTSSSEVAVRKRVLEEFSHQLSNRFHDHRDIEPTISEEEE